MKKGTIVSSLSVLAFLLSAPLLAGTIEGTVANIGAKDAGKVLVYVAQAPGTFPPPGAHVSMDQKNLVFLPFLLPVLQGTTVDFLNSDNVRHNVFSPDGEKFNLGTWQQGEIKSYTFKQLGDYSILCNVHPEMEAHVLTLQNPYFSKVAKDGTFKIAGIGDGEYTLKVWHPKKKFKETPVPVKGGKSGPVAIE